MAECGYSAIDKGVDNLGSEFQSVKGGETPHPRILPGGLPIVQLAMFDGDGALMDQDTSHFFSVEL